MNKKAKDFVRYGGQAGKMARAGYNQVGSVGGWVVSLAAFVGLSVAAVSEFFLHTSVNVPIGWLVGGIGLAIYLIVCFSWTAYKFRPTPDLDFVRRAIFGTRFSDPPSGPGNDRLRYCVTIRNTSRSTLKECGLMLETLLTDTIEGAFNGPELVKLPLGSGTYTLREGESEEIEICWMPVGSTHLIWSSRNGRSKPVQEYVVTLMLYGEGVPPTRAKVRVKPHGEGLAVSFMDPE
ncbi:hypothetical protein [Limnoglobus roseus]|uniref:DUF11 domain-containing protein n=1 Tax=Limnoglobus roseus TaxID=2598579 RepID=A0A5C1AGE9_9BACT|nr:hypothetical protein [Limnoglobus roseus]QEL18499.1 hypothetical protein PX52LOC_05525 [Limnoglobus roseus]